MFTEAVRAIARKELSDKLKSRWVIVIAAGFAVFTLVISYFGGATAGVTGFRNMEATIASLTSLVTYFIPILALTLGGGIIADEHDKGTLEIYLASPLSPAEFLTAKFLGLAVALALAMTAGLGIAGIALAVSSGGKALPSYLLFMANSTLLGLIFLSVSLLVSVLFRERARVIAVTVFLWLLFTVLYDLGLIGLLIVTKGAVGNGIFSAVLALNPVDVYRVVNFLTIGEMKVFLGLVSVDLPSYMRAPLLLTVSLAWMAVPLLLSYRLFRKRHVA